MGKTQSPEQKAAAALEKLRKEAKALVIEYPTEATAEQLKTLIDAKKAEIEAAEATKEDKKGKQTSFDVLNAGGDFVRTYSVEQHGSEAEEKAKEYAKKVGGTVK
jgi:hypothetical protein